MSSNLQSDTMKNPENVSQQKLIELLNILKHLANTRVAKWKNQEENTDFNKNLMNFDKNELSLDLEEHDISKPFQVVYDASRKPIGYIAEAPEVSPSTHKPNNENYYIDSILQSLASKNNNKQLDKNIVQKQKPFNDVGFKTKKIIVRRVPFKVPDFSQNFLTNSLGTPEVQETIIDPIKRTVTTVAKYPSYDESSQIAARWSPFAGYFPILIRDPFQSYYESFSDLIEYGEEADICSKTKDSVRQGKDMLEIDYEKNDGSKGDANDGEPEKPDGEVQSRNLRDHVTHQNIRRKRSTHEYELDHKPYKYLPQQRRINSKSTMKLHSKNPFFNSHNKNKVHWAWNKTKKNKENLEKVSDTSGSYKGPKIGNLKVRRGGVAIAGPGGIATAGSGGTAILGPGQSAYTTASGENFGRSGGVAVVGPSHKIISVPDAEDSNLLNLPPGAKLLTTGPIVYMNPVVKNSQTDNRST